MKIQMLPRYWFVQMAWDVVLVAEARRTCSDDDKADKIGIKSDSHPAREVDR